MKKTVKVSERYGKLTVIEKIIQAVPYRRTSWKCKCECGNVVVKSGSYLLHSPNPSCGCDTNEQDYYPELIGKTFGELTVQEIKKIKGKHSVAICKCSCGKITRTNLYNLKNGKTTSCGHENLKYLKNGYEIRKIASINNTNINSINDRKKNKNNKSGHTGVSQMENGKYRAYINFQHKQYHLGSYEKLEDAVRARKVAEEKIYGTFLNWYAETYPENWEKLNKKRDK